MNLNPDFVRTQIEALRRNCPELAEDDEAWLLSLESETSIDELLTSIVDRLDDVAALAGGLAGKIAEFEVRQDRYKQQQFKLREIALAVMQAAGIPKKELPSATLSIRKGGTKVVITDEAYVPDIFCRITRAPDKAKIKEHLLAGTQMNWANLETTPETLTVRTK